MSRLLCVSLLLCSLVLNSCAIAPCSHQLAETAEPGAAWNPPPAESENAIRRWCKAHPWAVATALLVGAAGNLILGGAAFVYVANHHQGP